MIDEGLDRDVGTFREVLGAGQMDAAKAQADGWPYAGYRMAIFSNDEEHYAR